MLAKVSRMKKRFLLKCYTVTQAKQSVLRRMLMFPEVIKAKKLVIFCLLRDAKDLIKTKQLKILPVESENS